MIVIVEGKNDYNKIKSVYPNLSILITNGSAVSDEFLDLVKKIRETNQIVLCLDPDYAGEKIRKTLLSVVPNAYQVFADRERAISKNGKKIGIEHMSKDDIRKLFSKIMISDYHENITMNDMYDLGLIGSSDSALKREELGKKLGIGYANAKTFLRRLNMFNITIEDIKRNL